MVVNGLRWVFVPISAILGWWIVIVLGLGLYSTVESFCPGDEMISSICTADWINNITTPITYITAGLSAVMVVLSVTLVAPKYKLRIAVIAYTLGLFIATWLLFGSDLFRAFRGLQTFHFSWAGFGLLAAPCIAGAFTVLFLRNFLARKVLDRS